MEKAFYTFWKVFLLKTEQKPIFALKAAKLKNI